jgi:nucleoside 2-deoxyribosyltransferase
MKRSLISRIERLEGSSRYSDPGEKVAVAFFRKLQLTVAHWVWRWEARRPDRFRKDFKRYTTPGSDERRAAMQAWRSARAESWKSREWALKVTYTIYSAGGLFTQDELSTNILIKEALWRLSNGKFQLFLPQSRELQELNRPDVEAYIRNTDLLEVVKADMILVRFEGLELDSGTVVEFAMAKCLGKPAVILRSDFRRVPFGGLCEPCNLMVKNWPRTVEVQLNSFEIWADLFAKGRQGLGDSDMLQGMMRAELRTLQKCVDEIAKQIMAGLEAVIEMKSPYPPEYQGIVYQASRFSPGSGFAELLTSRAMD